VLYADQFSPREGAGELCDPVIDHAVRYLLAVIPRMRPCLSQVKGLQIAHQFEPGRSSACCRKVGETAQSQTLARCVQPAQRSDHNEACVRAASRFHNYEPVLRPAFPPAPHLVPVEACRLAVLAAPGIQMSFAVDRASAPTRSLRLRASPRVSRRTLPTDPRSLRALIGEASSQYRSRSATPLQASVPGASPFWI